MIEKEYRDSCNRMVGMERAKTFVCLVGTTDDCTGITSKATIRDMIVMFTNAALSSPPILTALLESVSVLKEYEKDIANSEAKC